MSEQDPTPIDDRNDTSRWQWTSFIKLGKSSWKKSSYRFWRVPTGVQAARMSICKGCKHFNPKLRTCRVCGCAMRLKTWIGGFSCPKGKWPALTKPELENLES